MKGFVFTLDALFSLMIAATGLAVLFYFTYTAPAPYFIQYSFSSSLLSSFVSTRLNLVTSIPLISYIAQQYAASNQKWNMPTGNQYGNAGNSYGPSALTLNFVVNANANVINGTIVSNYGNVYFGAGNVIYAVNVSSGSTEWTSNAPYNALAPDINATLLYGGMLIYATQSNIVALNAHNGTTVWSTSTLYSTLLSSEPTHTTAPIKLLMYNGKIITSTYDSSNSRSSLIYSLYPNNGTIVGSAPLYANAIQYSAISGGQIVLSTSNNNVMMVTQILNNSYAAGTIWSLGTSCSNPSYPVGIASYANVIFYGCGANYANVIGVNQNPILSDPLVSPNTVTGLSVFKGLALFQSTSGLTLLNMSAQRWSLGIPAVYGASVANAIPIISSQNVYTLWSNGYLLMDNLSTGAILANTLIPYSGAINPYMALAYGRLFLSKGSHLMEFGACPVNPNESILSAIGTLYINGQGSCANYLLSILRPGGNYSVSINGLAPYTGVKLSGTSSYVDIPSSDLSQLKTFTVSMWVDPGSYSNTPGLYSYDFNGEKLLITPGGNVESDIWNGASDSVAESTTALSANEWYLVTQTVAFNSISSTTTHSIWIDGANQSSATVSGSVVTGTSGSSIGSVWTQYPYFNGIITNVQIYKNTLSAPQIEAIYTGGISSPPVSYANLVGWWPLNGDTNGYGNAYTAGYPVNVAFQQVTYNSISLQNSFSVTSQSVPLPLLNYTTGKYKLYNVGVYSWR